MEQVFERVCGLDVHKATIAACVRVPGVKGQRLQSVQTFGTTTADLLAHVAEASGLGKRQTALPKTVPETA
jgi:transposase